MLVIAHRGASKKAPENTISALQMAAHEGVSFVECDVRLTADDELVIFHDKDLSRTTNGKGIVTKKTLAEIKSLDAGQWFDTQFTNERVPTLDEWLKNAVYLRLSLNIEVKRTSRYKQVVNLLLAKIDEVWPADMDKPLISSFSHRVLKYLASKERADINYALNVKKWLFFYPRFIERPNCVSVHINVSSITPELIKTLHSMKKRVFVYTVNELIKAKQLAEMGVDGIFSDNLNLINQF
jgi:glycerophosphoryl diester phosphodiesterase